MSPLSESALVAGRVVTLTDGETIPWAANQGCAYSVILTGNDLFENPTQLQGGTIYVLSIAQDSTGSRIPTWGSAFQFPDGVATTLTATALATDILFFYSDGSTLKLISSSLNVGTPIAAPSGLSASNDQIGQVSLAWTNHATAETADGTKIYRDDVVIATVAITVTEYVDVVDQGSYVYKVRAYRGSILSGDSAASGESLPPD